MLKENCSQIGYISKAHGTGGQVVFYLSGDFADDLEPGEPVFLEINETLVPFFIEETEGFTEKAIVKLEFIDDPVTAKKYSGCKVYLDISEKKLSVSDSGNDKGFTGYTIIDEVSGFSGIVTGVADIASNPLFEVFNEKEYLIPAQPDLILDIDHESKIIKMKLPEGLIG